jgi:hypothetical protein
MSIEVESVFFAEFDNELGPKISFQSPAASISADYFAQFSDYVIPDTELCFKFIVLPFKHHTIVGYPVRLENKKYHRNQLLFNLGIVLSSKASPNKFEHVCKKIGHTLKALELESEYIFDPTQKAQLEDILHKILADLRRDLETTIRFSKCLFFFFVFLDLW